MMFSCRTDELTVQGGVLGLGHRLQLPEPAAGTQGRPHHSCTSTLRLVSYPLPGLLDGGQQGIVLLIL